MRRTAMHTANRVTIGLFVGLIGLNLYGIATADSPWFIILFIILAIYDAILANKIIKQDRLETRMEKEWDKACKDHYGEDSDECKG